MTVKTEESALYDSQSNGLAESAVKDAVRTNWRVLSSALCRSLQVASGLALACEVLCDGEQMQVSSRWQDSLRGAQGVQVRASTAAFCGKKILFMVPAVTKGMVSGAEMGGRGLPRCV